MQQGSLIRSARKRGPDVWQFRWADRGPYGKRIYRKRLIVVRLSALAFLCLPLPTAEVSRAIRKLLPAPALFSRMLRSLKRDTHRDTQ
jgi:hypothetical protein